MKKTLLAAAVGAAMLSTTVAAEARTAWVLSNRDAGPWTFRAAVERANRDPSIDRIQFRPRLRSIGLRSTVEYTGAQPLLVSGAGVRVKSRGAGDLFVASGGGDLSLERIRFSGALKTGVTVNVPAGDTIRQQTVSLEHVTLDGNGWYGLHFDDQSGGDGTGADSAASLRLIINQSAIIGNNDPAVDAIAADKDGVRVDEGGEGDVTAQITDSVLDGNFAEGIEIDETGEGDVIVTASSSSFSNNGAQPQLPEDLEDGLDVDENDAGDIWITILDSEINGNQDEGLDLDEVGAGDVYLTTVNMEASGNLDENVKVSQLQNADLALAGVEGTVVARFTRTTVNDSIDGDGIKLESFDDEATENLFGSVFATITNSEVTGNDSDEVQLEGASGRLVLRNTPIDPEGIDLKGNIDTVILP